MKIIGNYSIFFGLNRRLTFLTLSASGPLASGGVSIPALFCLFASINCIRFSGNPLFAALLRALVNAFADVLHCEPVFLCSSEISRSYI